MVLDAILSCAAPAMGVSVRTALFSFEGTTLAARSTLYAFDAQRRRFRSYRGWIVRSRPVKRTTVREP